MKPLKPEDITTRIDPNNLDDELVKHPELARIVGEQYVAAMSAKDSYEVESKEMLSREARAVRERMERKGHKITEAAVKERLEGSDVVKAIRQREAYLMDQVRQWDNLQGVVRSRGYILHKIVDLRIMHGGAINNTTKTTKAGGKMVDEQKDKAVQRAVERRRKGRLSEE